MTIYLAELHGCAVCARVCVRERVLGFVIDIKCVALNSRLPIKIRHRTVQCIHTTFLHIFWTLIGCVILRKCFCVLIVALQHSQTMQRSTVQHSTSSNRTATAQFSHNLRPKRVARARALSLFLILQ